MNEQCNLIWKNLIEDDEINLKELNNIISSPKIIKQNLIEYLLNSDSGLPLLDKNDIIQFFKILNPLNLELKMGSIEWNSKYVDNKILLIQNSISKKDSRDNKFSRFIYLVKNKLIKSNIKFTYFEFDTNRFFKSKDIIFVMT